MTRGRVRAGVLALVAVSGLGLVACAESNTPTEYNGLTQQNFLETCTNLYFESTDGTVDPANPTGNTVVEDYTGASTSNCECQYSVFAGPDNDGNGLMTIEAFTTLNSDLKDDPQGTWDALPDNVKTALKACPTDDSSSPTSTTSTSQSTTTTAGA